VNIIELNGKKLYNTKAFAEKAVISRQWIHKAKLTGEGGFPSPYIKIANSDFWLESQVENFIKERRNK
jgi:hypothetical protein